LLRSRNVCVQLRVKLAILATEISVVDAEAVSFRSEASVLLLDALQLGVAWDLLLCRGQDGH
jgi:hypothetical protein